MLSCPYEGCGQSQILISAGILGFNYPTFQAFPGILGVYSSQIRENYSFKTRGFSSPNRKLLECIYK
jgi:hypothetical protein